MFFRSHKPLPPLASCVDYYWYLSHVPNHERERIVPSGTLEIVINLHEDEIRIYDLADPRKFTSYSGTVVSGAHRGYFVVDTRAHASIIGVHFSPGGAFPLLGVPPGSLMDKHVDLAAIWGTRAAHLRERLCVARDLDERFQILGDELTRRLNSAVHSRDEVKFAIRQLMRTNARVSQVAAAVELSHRRLIEIFTAEVGIAPKVFSRVQRLQRALALAKQEASPDWTQVAATCGYFDQPHLIRESILLSGLSPKELLRGSADVKVHHAALAQHQG